MGLIEGLLNLFDKGTKENSEYANDAEKWVVATYAMWSEYAGGNWKKLGGYLKNGADASMMRGVLRRDWGIENIEDGLEEVEVLIDTEAHLGDETDAWDYCRAAQLLGMFYISGYMTREEMMIKAHDVAEVIKANFDSWEELCRSYIAGYAEWVEDEEAVNERKSIYERLQNTPDGPYSVDWNTEV